MNLKAIITKHKPAVDVFLDGGDLSEELYDDLYDYYCSTNEMPYGTAKARTGDPHEWITKRFEDDAWAY